MAQIQDCVRESSVQNIKSNVHTKNEQTVVGMESEGRLIDYTNTHSLSHSLSLEKHLGMKPSKDPWAACFITDAVLFRQRTKPWLCPGHSLLSREAGEEYSLLLACVNIITLPCI